MKRPDKRVVGLILTIAVVLALVVSWVYFGTTAKSEVCNQTDIRIYSDEELFFVTENRIQELLMDANRMSPVGRPMNELNLKAMEARIRRHPMVRNANVYLHLNGRLVVQVWQKEPILRIQKSDGYGFYLDSEGHEFPLSRNYTARVPIANGNIDSVMVRKLYTLAGFVHENSFWKANTEQIFVDAERNMVLIPKLGRAKLIIGDVDRIKEKLNDLSLLYLNGLPAMGWEQYERIDVKFKDLIICK